MEDLLPFSEPGLGGEVGDQFDLAAEFVLGTLGARERTVVMELRASDPGFDAQVRGLEARLAPLLMMVPETEPPPGLQDSILARVADVQEDGAVPVAVLQEIVPVQVLRRALARWRIAAVLLGLVAVVLGAVLTANLLGASRQQGPLYVAALTDGGASPAFVLSLDTGEGVIQVRRVGVGAPQEKAYELWAVEGAGSPPISLGVVDTELKVPLSSLGAADFTVFADTNFAVSLEPKGGSPTGQPTGPVAYVGKLYSTGG